MDCVVNNGFSNRVQLFLVSFLGLFFELMIIRYLGSEIRILAYFTNIVLMSCILGLGLGMLVQEARKIKASTFLILLMSLLALVFFIHGGSIHLPLSSNEQFIWNGLSRVNTIYMIQYISVIAFFSLNTLLFIPLGGLIGEYFDRLEYLSAYSVNVLGSLLGIVFFTLLSYFNIQPIWWFVSAIFIYAFCVRKHMSKKLGAYIAVSLIFICAFVSYNKNTFWSPYYKINLEKINGLPQTKGGSSVKGFTLLVNDDSHMQTLDLSGRFDHIKELKKRRLIYDAPYAFGPKESVLIVGAGTGNDIAAALRAGAKEVDAVEIDPLILNFGLKHPERPYQNEKVTIYNTDARSFLTNSKKHYDKIVLGYLDSHTLFSSMSSLRLDNFVYTQEFFDILKKHLGGEGVLSVTFTVHEAWIANRLYSLFKNTFLVDPIIYQGGAFSSKGTVFLGGEDLDKQTVEYLDYNPVVQDDINHSWRYQFKGGYLNPNVFEHVKNVPTDNWPYLYLKDKKIPINYFLPLAIILIFSLVFIKAVGGEELKLDFPFFFLGAAFLLIETKAITELSLFIGSTWLTNAIVIGCILLLILVANYLSKYINEKRIKWVYGSLLLTLLLPALFPPSTYFEISDLVGKLLVSILLCSPLLFSGLIFAFKLRGCSKGSAALGSNLMGAMFGGIIEYCSLIYGFKILYLFAIILYALSFLSMRRGFNLMLPKSIKY